MKNVPSNWFDKDHPYHGLAWYLYENKDDISQEVFDAIVNGMEIVYEKYDAKEAGSKSKKDQSSNPTIAMRKLEKQNETLLETIQEQNRLLKRFVSATKYIQTKNPDLMREAYDVADGKKPAKKKKTISNKKKAKAV